MSIILSCFPSYIYIYIGVASDSTKFVNINSNCSGQEFNLQSCGNYLASLAGSCSAQLINIECEG